MKIKDLTKDQLWELRQEITLNSLFTRDYENSFGIKLEECITFFDSYAEFLCMNEENNADFFDIVNKYDNIENLYAYWCMLYGEWRE